MANDPQPESRRDPMRDVLDRLGALDARVVRLEHELGFESLTADSTRADAGVALEAATTADWLPLAGRTLLILGGAFVLRAVTEGGLLRPSVGVVLGIAYSLVWLIAADRAGTRGRSGSATWLGVAMVLIAYPLLWEATITFGFLGAGQAAAAVTIVSGLALVVVWRHRFTVLAWIVTVAAVGTLMSMAIATRLPGMFTLCVLAVGAATLWLGYLRDVRGPARLAAIAASLSVAMLGAVVILANPTRRAELIDVETVIWLQLALIGVYVGSAIARTLVRRRALHLGELVTGLTAAVVGLGGAVLVVRGTGTGALALGVVAGVLGLSGYWATFSLGGLSEQRANFVFFSSLALVFVLVALSVLLPPAWLVAVLAAATIAMAWAGAVRVRATLSLHGSIYAAAAAVVSGMLAHAFAAFGVPPGAGPGAFSLAMAIALAGALSACGFVVATREQTWGPLARLPKLVLIALAAVGLGGFALATASYALPPASGGAGVDGTWLAVLRTLVLALSAIALAWIGGYPRLRQAAWLVYPVLVAGGLKLLVEDLRVGGPGALVASFALYGGALIMAPRLMRRPDQGSTELDNAPETS